jgi:formimidoylglutamate deiminase
VLFEIDGGMLARIVPASSRDGATLLAGPVIAGMPNAHSHVAQRALAGRAEGAGPAGDSFWSWRETMYAFIERLDPETFEALAADAYAEMLEGGYTCVAEFHYLHHARDGVAYARPAEMAERIVSAAQRAGIGLTLLPVLYRFSDAGGVPPKPQQARFVHSLESFAAAFSATARVCAGKANVRLGAALHSLRAVSPEDVAPFLEIVDAYDAKSPLHVHVSEQVAEVEACRARYGAPPIETLARHAMLSSRWSLVHATHATGDELARIAAAGATVVACPTTEANLGDGIFPASEFLSIGGRIAIGSDSNLNFDVAEELRWLEYGQRLTQHRRHVLGSGAGSLGDELYARAAASGVRSLAQPIGVLQTGRRADLVVLAPLEDETPPSLDTCIFNSGAFRVRDVFVGGRQVVRDGAHVERPAFRARARAARSRLGGGVN